MAKIYFYYRSMKETSHLTIRLTHSNFDRTKIDIKTNSTYIINKKYWNATKNLIKGTDATAKNHRVEILKLENFILDEFSKINNRGIQITKDWLKLELEKFFGRINQPQHMNFLEYYDWHIKHHTDMPIPTTGKPLAKSSIKTYKSSFALIKRFNDEVYLLSYENITLDFYEDFLNFLYDLNYSRNYIGSQIKTLKTIMNASFELNYHNNKDYNKRAFKKPSEDVFNIALTEKELITIFHLDFKDFKPKRLNNGTTLNSKVLDTARDLFLIGANTGLRVSDFNYLNQENIVKIDSKNYLKLTTKKTNSNATIPISPIVQSILDKYIESKLPKLQDQKINYALKEIGKLANINEKVTFKETKGRLTTHKTLFKYEMITNHTARRSFCTNAYMSKMPTIDIMTISGHKSTKVFLNYIKITEEERAIKIGNNPFFNQPILKKA